MQQHYRPSTLSILNNTTIFTNSSPLKAHLSSINNGPRIMTSRPALGLQRPAVRSSSTTNIIPQRPSAHRTLSQQHFPSGSPTRRGGNEAFVDLTLESDPAGRYGTIPRMGSSRLRVEISESINDFVASPKQNPDSAAHWRSSHPPRGRPQLHFDVPNVSNLSPRAAQDGASATETTIKPMPLPSRPRQHAPPPAEKAQATPRNIAKKEARPKPYVLEVPTIAPQYPPNGMLKSHLCKEDILTPERPCRFLSLDRKPCRRSVFRIYHPSWLF